MATERLAMRKLRDILRLHFLGNVTSSRKIALAVGCGKTAVLDCLRRAPLVGIASWSDVELLDETALENKFFSSAPSARGPSERAAPDWSKLHEEMRRPGHQMTLALLWTEYRAENPDGYQYSRFAELYRIWTKKLSLVMRQNHVPGEKAFVDYCDGLFVTDARSGERKPTELFVGTLGASSYTFATATFTQALPAWLDSHARMYEFFGGVPMVTVPDNLRSAVTRADRYEAELNPSYRELAEHYGTCIIPARPYRPRDKGKVEAAVLVAQRWILASLRNRKFYSLNEINEAIVPLLVKLNNRVMRHVKQSRSELFEKLDRPALKPLPAGRYEFAAWKKVRLNIDYHFEFEDHFYSSAYTLYGEELWCRASGDTIEIFAKGSRVGCHVRSFIKGKYTTTPEHRPASHRAHAEWTPSRIIAWAATIGPNTAALIEEVIRSKPHPEQGFRSALGIIRLEKKHTRERLEKASEKALKLGSPSYRTVETMLKNKMESVPLGTQLNRPVERGEQLELLAAPNLREKNYYH